MKIGAFVARCETTKDTIRHYEQLHLIQPKKIGTYKDYGEKEFVDFQVVKEMQKMDLSLAQIQQIFCMKEKSGCGTATLIQSVLEALKKQSFALAAEEQRIKQKRVRTEHLIAKLKRIESSMQ
ncbi:MerR family transcriptional regulator [Sporolactobacillus terrae]|uniref:MerR family transcriptional regulator n=1 Tax=Sporolactobacillus terrae TaxID=269673 RepID=A0ABX5Q9A2_9BACL|nr:MerR family transcriptional regulator [Sporolactobacillus terrae]QAA23180.1 MerR family transcriptional regulator [Sporolactobacillus terrae]QAA26150.1 MerR family transcriptional regulator [Sporolactobacillus terrae]UAK15245.1 MerR family transcriptional regulator [Sporolactobacillus terrae]